MSVNGVARIIDIGSGNGVLAVKLTQQYGEADVTGMDYWGEDWEYSRSVCERNARLVGVNDVFIFQEEMLPSSVLRMTRLMAQPAT